jgi:hypothetical protein
MFSTLIRIWKVMRVISILLGRSKMGWPLRVCGYSPMWSMVAFWFLASEKLQIHGHWAYGSAASSNSCNILVAYHPLSPTVPVPVCLIYVSHIFGGIEVVCDPRTIDKSSTCKSKRENDGVWALWALITMRGIEDITSGREIRANTSQLVSGRGDIGKGSI